MAVKAPVLDRQHRVDEVLRQGIGGDHGAGGLAPARNGAAIAIQQNGFTGVRRGFYRAEIGQGARQMHDDACGQQSAGDHQYGEHAQPDRHAAFAGSGGAVCASHDSVQT
jgi:hypothetical protein